MDSLFTQDQRIFQRCCQHIATFRQPISTNWKHFLSCELSTANLSPDRFSFYNVPKWKGYLLVVEKRVASSPGPTIEVHGQNVMLDEKAVENDPNTTFGMRRFAARSAAFRRKHANRYLYEYTMLNFALAASTIIGTTFLYYGKTVQSWRKMQNPFFSVFATIGFTAMTFPFLQYFLIPFCSIDAILSERADRKCLATIKCEDCLNDLNEYTGQQLMDLKGGKSNTNSGGGGERNVSLVSGNADDEEKENFSQRSSSASRSQKKQQLEIQTQQRMLMTQMKEVKSIVRNWKGKRCEVHQGIRQAPDSYRHDKDWFVSEKDRENARKRNEE